MGSLPEALLLLWVCLSDFLDCPSLPLSPASLPVPLPHLPDSLPLPHLPLPFLSLLFGAVQSRGRGQAGVSRAVPTPPPGAWVTPGAQREPFALGVSGPPLFPRGWALQVGLPPALEEDKGMSLAARGASGVEYLASLRTGDSRGMVDANGPSDRWQRERGLESPGPAPMSRDCHKVLVGRGWGLGGVQAAGLG